MRFVWLLLLTSVLLFNSSTWSAPTDDGVKLKEEAVEKPVAGEDDIPSGDEDSGLPGGPKPGPGKEPDEEPDEEPGPNPKPKPVLKDFPNIFDIEGIEKEGISRQIGFTVGVEYIGNKLSRLSEETYREHKRGGEGDRKDNTVYRSQVRLRKKDFDETMILLEEKNEKKTKEIFVLHEGERSCKFPDDLDDIWTGMKEFLPEGLNTELTNVRQENHNKGFYLGPAAAIFQLGNKWFEDGQIKYVGRHIEDDVEIPRKPGKKPDENEGKNEKENEEENEEPMPDYILGRKELNTWEGEVGNRNRQVTVRYRFSLEKDDSDGKKLVQVPISFEARVKVEGQEATKQSLYFTNFRHFKNEANEELPYIRVPVGYRCERTTDPEKMVDIPPKQEPEQFMEKDFDVELEVVSEACADEHRDSCTQAIFNAKMHHLQVYNLISIDQTITTLGGTVSRKRVKHIVDLNEMLRYDIETENSFCLSTEVSDDFEEIHGHEKDKPETQAKESEKKWHFTPALDILENLQRLKLFQPKFFAVTDQDFYMGSNTVRDIKVVTYEGTYDNEYAVGDRSVKVLVTKHFIDDDFTKKEGAFLTMHAPTEIVFRVIDTEMPSLQTAITVNIHKFQVGAVDHEVQRSAFDITPCFNGPMQSTWFEMVFPVQEQMAQEKGGSEKEIENAFRNALGELPPNRLPVVIVDNAKEFIIVSAQLLNRPDDIFDRIENQQITHERRDASNSFLIESPQLCERRCLDSEEGVCTAFSFCENLDCDLHISTSGEIKPPEVESADGCYTYRKKTNVPNNVLGDEGLTMAKHTHVGVLSMIDQQIKDKQMKITLDRIEKDGKKVAQDIEATVLIRDVDPGFMANKRFKKDEDKEESLTELTKGYKMHKKNSEFAYSDEALEKHKFKQLIGMPTKDCARLCNEDESCKSFSTCTDLNMNCILAPVDYEGITTEMIDDVRFSCNIMTKTFLHDYDEMEKMKLKKVAKAVLQDVASEEACAKDCSAKTDFECRSFDFCIDSSGDETKHVCLEHESHIFHQNEGEKDIGLDLKTTTCNHYSRVYTRDFTLQKMKKLSSKVTIAVTKTGVSAEECAKQCASDEDNDCYHFDFCETMSEAGKKPDRVCRFAKGSTVPTLEEDKTCKTYSIKAKVLRARKPVPVDPPTEPVKPPTPLKDKGGVSPTISVFFSLFFVALAAVGGIFSYRYYEKWRATRATSSE